MSYKPKRKFSLRQIYEAMLYGVPKVKGKFWHKVRNEKKGLDLIEGACAIGRIAMNLGEDDFNDLYGALGQIKIIPESKKGTPKYAQSLAAYIIGLNDRSDISIEDIAEKIKPLINLDQVIEV